MKTMFTLFLLTLICGYVYSQNMVIEVAKSPSPITIDGIAESTWNMVDSFSISSWGEDNPTPDPSDFAANFKILWDDEFLYFLCNVFDDVLMETDGLSGVVDWEVDNIEFYWAPGNSKTDDASKMIQVRFPYANANNEDPTPGIKNGWSPGGFSLPDFVNAAIDKRDSEYTIEFSVDLAVSAESVDLPSLGLNDTVGCNIIACDNDDDVVRKHIGSLIENFQWDQADTMLRLVFVEALSFINSKETEPSLLFHPNPVKDVIIIPGYSGFSSLEIVNMHGQVVLVNKDIRREEYLGNLQPGLYFIRIKDKQGGLLTGKLNKK